MGPPIYQSADALSPDSEFIAGALRFLVAGNAGRMLDARRTPMRVVGVDVALGSFTVRIEAFEDADAEWVLALDEISRFQFRPDAVTLGPAPAAALEQSRLRFAEDVTVACDLEVRAAVLRELAERRRATTAWLKPRLAGRRPSVDELVAGRRGDPVLFALLARHLEERGLRDIDETFADTYVSNPRSGEVVKGHELVLADLGLCPYHGRTPRDPHLFDGAWSRARRSEHLLWRMAFTQALLVLLGAQDEDVFRASASDRPLRPSRQGSFTSASFSRSVAEEHFSGGPTTRYAVFTREPLPLDRTLMTFIETPAMNAAYLEAEAVIWHSDLDGGVGW